MEFAPQVLIFAGGIIVDRTHAGQANYMVREGLAVPRKPSRRVKAIDLIESTPDPNAPAAHGNPQKYTYREALGNPIDGHCHTLKHIPRRSWPIFRAALVDCLPRTQQEEIRALFT